MEVIDGLGRYVEVHEAIIAVCVRGLILIDGPKELWEGRMDWMDFEDHEIEGHSPNKPGIYRCNVKVRWDDEFISFEISESRKIADCLSGD